LLQTYGHIVLKP